jgi:translation initiation factor 4G
VINFKKSVASPVSATPSRGPAVVSSGGAPPTAATPPRVVTPSAPQQSRAESVAQKSAEERKKEFEETVKRQLEQEKKDNEAKLKAQQDKEEAAKKPEVEVEAAPKVSEKPVESEAEPEVAATAGESEEERKKREDDEEFERMIAEMEEEERRREEKEKEYELKKKAKQEEEKRKADEKAANEDEEMKRLEREAEEREEAKTKGKTEIDSDVESKDLFSQLKKNTMFGPGASGTPASETSTPGSESPMPPPAQPASATKPTLLANKQKPAALKLETTKTVEPAQPTAGMQALKTARFLEVKNDVINYPEGIKSPNPALNQNIKARGQRYDNNFLLQFKEVFKEKPSTDWDRTLKDTVGDSTDSARPQTARTPSVTQGGRSMSGRPGAAPMGGLMGSFVGAGGRTLPPGTSSEQRFAMAGSSRPSIPNAFGSFPAGRPGAFPMGGQGMVRTPSSQSMQGMNSPRNASHRGKGSRRGGPNPAQEADMQKKMPLTAGMSISPLEVSQTGWKPTSLTQPAAVAAAAQQGHMLPDIVQRKVKAALNKMTPEKFDKISGDILAIASQSKDETDGRTLRQVIQLTFEKACDEAHWSSMYAKFCERMLQDMGPDIRDEGVKDKHGQVVVGGALFRKYLLNRCQEEFERGWEVNLPDKPEGETEEAAMLSDEYYIAAAAKRKGLGLIQFIGELYKLGMLTLRIMHECVVKLLNFEGTPDEAAIESLVKLLRTIGGVMDSDPKGHSMMDTYIDRIQTIMKIDGLPSRQYYMLLDTTELRRKQWRSKDDQKGPKTITEIREEASAAHAAAELERQRNPRGGPGGRSQAGRGDVRQFSGGGMPAPEYRSTSVGMDDLKKLTRNARPTATGGSGLGPNSLLSSSRQSSRRGGLGPRVGDESGGSSRTGTPPVKEKESTAHVNAYRYACSHHPLIQVVHANNYHSALAALEDDHPDDVASPPSQHASPAITKAQPAAAGEADAGK